MSESDPAIESRRAQARHWRRTRRLTAVLLLAWFAVGFGATWFARDLDFAFLGWPFSFWLAAQGGVLVFVALLVAYAKGMARIDRGLADTHAPDATDTTG